MIDSPTPRRSIREKLDRLMLLSLGSALILATAFNLWREADRFLAYRRDTLVATAQVLAAATSAAVAANDASAARRALRVVDRIPGLVHAEVQTSDGHVLAELGSAISLRSRELDLDAASVGATLSLVTKQTIRLSAPLIEGGEPVGRIVLVSETGDLLSRFRDALLVSLLGSIAALGVALILSRRLQGAITRPITFLARAMANVEETADLRTVADPGSDDETSLLAARFNGMIGEIRRATDEILVRENEIITRLARAGEQRDDQTGQHVVRVAKVSRIIADGLKLDPGFIEDLCRASPMHDVGKISVPDAILFKPGRLTPEERGQMERHAKAGHEVLAGSASRLVQLAAEIAISHHERWDGAGYPNRISGTTIPISGRITAVADVCDALLSARPYKEPWSLEAVRAHLLENAGTHFDPDCVAALLMSWPALERVYAARAETLAADSDAA